MNYKTKERKLFRDCYNAYYRGDKEKYLSLHEIIHRLGLLDEFNRYWNERLNSSR